MYRHLTKPRPERADGSRSIDVSTEQTTIVRRSERPAGDWPVNERWANSGAYSDLLATADEHWTESNWPNRSGAI